MEPLNKQKKKSNKKFMKTTSNQDIDNTKDEISKTIKVEKNDMEDEDNKVNENNKVNGNNKIHEMNKEEGSYKNHENNKEDSNNKEYENYKEDGNIKNHENHKEDGINKEDKINKIQDSSIKEVLGKKNKKVVKRYKENIDLKQEFSNEREEKKKEKDNKKNIFSPSRNSTASVKYLNTSKNKILEDSPPSSRSKHTSKRSTKYIPINENSELAGKYYC